MKLKELVEVMDSSLNYDVYYPHKYSNILYSSDARVSSIEAERNRREELFKSILDKTVTQVSASDDNQTLEIFIEED